MGHSVSPIGKHNLDTRSIEALAADLSKRFKANVEYGYYDMFGYDAEGNEYEPSFENVLFGKIIYPGADKTLWLSDEFHQVHKLIDKYGAGAYELPIIKKYKYNKEEMEAAINSVCYHLLDLVDFEDYGTIYNDVFNDLNHSFDGRWHFFNLAFTDEDPDGGLMEKVSSYRKEIMQFYGKIGGTEVYYLDDQGETQYLVETFFNWQTILNELNTKFKETTLHIPGFIKHKKRLTRDNLPLAFYDDFEDIRNG